MRSARRLILAGITLGLLAACAPGKQITPSHERSAREIVRLSWSEAFVDALVELIAQSTWDVMLATPEGAGFVQLTESQQDRVRAALQLWAREMITLPAIEDALVRIWMGHFSESEIEEMRAFYGTPVGVKFLRLGEMLARAGAEAAPVREAFERWDVTTPPPPELRDVFVQFAQEFDEGEREELRRVSNSPAVRKGAELTPRLIAETTRELQKILASPAAVRRFRELLQRALPERRLPV